MAEIVQIFIALCFQKQGFSNDILNNMSSRKGIFKMKIAASKLRLFVLPST